MISGRTLLLLALVAASWWLWRSGEWQTVATRFSTALDQLTATIDEPPPATRSHPALPAANSPASAPAAATVSTAAATPAASEIRTWVDAQGVRHFASAPLAPKSSATHEAGPATILKDYGQPLRESQARASAATNDGQPSRSAPDATTAAYELMDNMEKRLEAIRQENKR